MRENDKISESTTTSEDKITRHLGGIDSGRNITQRAEGMYVFNREDNSTWTGLQGKKPLKAPKAHVFVDQVLGIGVGTMLVMPPISAWLGLTPLTTTILVGLSLMTLMSLYRRYEYSRPGRMDRFQARLDQLHLVMAEQPFDVRLQRLEIPHCITPSLEQPVFPPSVSQGEPEGLAQSRFCLLLKV